MGAVLQKIFFFVDIAGMNQDAAGCPFSLKARNMKTKS